MPHDHMWRIPLSDLDYDETEQQAVGDVLRSRWLSMGPRTEEFEARAAEYLGVRHAIAVANGTCALEMAYQQLLAPVGEKSAGLGKGGGGGRTAPGREQATVVVPDMTFVATANAALFAGARVDLADIRNPHTPLLHPGQADRLAQQAAEGGAPCLVAPVHYAGFDAGAEELREVTRRSGARLVEDAAHAIGARTASGRMLGTVGDVGCFSFFANKNLATGEGGLVVTHDDEVAAGLRLLRSHGMTSLTWKRHSTRGHGYDVLAPGHNYRITEITAALALVQLAKLDRGNARRRRLYRLYREAFRAEVRLRVPFADQDDSIENSSCHIFPLLCESAELRDRVRAALNEAGVQTSHHYPPIHTFTFYRELLDMETVSAEPSPGGETGRFGAAERFAEREITLPLHPNLKEIELEEVAAIVLRTVASFQ